MNENTVVVTGAAIYIYMMQKLLLHFLALFGMLYNKELFLKSGLT